MSSRLLVAKPHDFDETAATDNAVQSHSAPLREYLTESASSLRGPNVDDSLRMTFLKQVQQSIFK